MNVRSLILIRKYLYNTELVGLPPKKLALLRERFETLHAQMRAAIPGEYRHSEYYSLFPPELVDQMKKLIQEFDILVDDHDPVKPNSWDEFDKQVLSTLASR